MVQNLLSNFLSDPREYTRAEAIWRDRWRELVRTEGQESLWRDPWINTNLGDGTPFRDGNPIFSAISPYRRLGVRVIQIEPSDAPNEFHSWIDTFAKGEPEEIEELVITCALSDQTMSDAIALMKRWITK